MKSYLVDGVYILPFRVNQGFKGVKIQKVTRDFIVFREVSSIFELGSINTERTIKKSKKNFELMFKI